MTKPLLLVGFVILIAVVSFLASLLFWSNYIRSDAKDFEADLFEISYETQFRQNSFATAYCYEQHSQDTVRQLYGLLNSYIYQHQNDVEMFGFDESTAESFDETLEEFEDSFSDSVQYSYEINIYKSFTRLAKIFLNLGQNEKSMRAMKLAKLFYRLNHNEKSTVSDEFLFEKLVEQDKRFCFLFGQNPIKNTK